jgi:hypothetical protein
MFICEYCEKNIKNLGGLVTHTPYCPNNPNRVKRKKSPNAHVKKGSTNWAKGLTKHTDDRIRKREQKLKGIRFGASLHGHTDETKKKLSIIAKQRKLGGYNRGSGRGCKGWYKGYFCDSSWELAFVIYCIDNNIEIKRNLEKRQYIWQNKIKNYIPDFIVEGALIEIKGYVTEEWKAKIHSNPDVKVLYGKDMKPIIDYVINKYGKNYTSLYKTLDNH